MSKTLLFPESTTNLNELLVLLIENLIGQELLQGKTICVPRYQFGGMSSGVASSDFWLGEVMPY
ncbi:hypothetical protein [Spirosoma daeguense]